MATVVLVPGAFCGGWAWKKVIPLLRAAGHDVYATTGTGLGDRVDLASPSVDLDTHIVDVVNVLEFEELTDVTLVGWSYGGMIITGVAERVPERLAQLVYFDATVPADGEDMYDTCGASDDARAADRAAAEAAGHPGFFGVPAGDFADLIRSWIPDPTDQVWFFPSWCPTLSPLTPSRYGWETQEPRRFRVHSFSAPKAKTQRTSPCLWRLGSGRRPVGDTGSWLTLTTRLLTSRRRPLMCSYLSSSQPETSRCGTKYEPDPAGGGCGRGKRAANAARMRAVAVTQSQFRDLGSTGSWSRPRVGSAAGPGRLGT